MKVGVDVDGVLADFNSGYIERTVQVTGVDLFPPRPFAIPCWKFPEHYGYTGRQMRAVWKSIKEDATFWLRLGDYPETQGDIDYLQRLVNQGADLYFITARPGVNAKVQTETWLWDRGLISPTVLMSKHKGLCALALGLDVYMDDKWENVYDVLSEGTECAIALRDRPWNQPNLDRPTLHSDIARLHYLEGFVEQITDLRPWGV